jgi:hypothetical protein
MPLDNLSPRRELLGAIQSVQVRYVGIYKGEMTYSLQSLCERSSASYPQRVKPPLLRFTTLHGGLPLLRTLLFVALIPRHSTRLRPNTIVVG